MVEADIPAVVAMGRAMHAESPRYARLSFSAEKVEALLRRMIGGTLVTEPPGGAFVAERKGVLVGMIGGYLTEPFFSEDKIASDYALYITPAERRKGGIAAGLIRAFERWAIDSGAVDIMPGVSTMIDAEATTKLYRKLGYEPYGNLLIKRVR